MLQMRVLQVPHRLFKLQLSLLQRFRFDSYSTGGRLWLIYAWLKGEIEWSEHFAEILYTCTTCKNCAEQCPMKFAPDIVDWIVGARSDMVEREDTPRVARFFEAVHGYGNPFKRLRSERAAWANGTKRYAPGDEYLRTSAAWARTTRTDRKWPLGAW